METAVRVSGLGKSYGGTAVLDPQAAPISKFHAFGSRQDVRP